MRLHPRLHNQEKGRTGRLDIEDRTASKSSSRPKLGSVPPKNECVCKRPLREFDSQDQDYYCVLCGRKLR